MYVNINLESIKTYRYSADASQSSDRSSFLKYQPSPFLQIFFPENKKSKNVIFIIHLFRKYDYN